MKINELNKENYNLIAKEFSSTRGYLWDDINLFLKYLKDGDFVLDIGCGNGRLIKALEGKKIKYLGLDNSDKLIEEAKKLFPENDFAISDIKEEPAKQKADCAFMIAVLNHFPKKDQQAVIENVKASMKKGGYLFLLNWNLWQVGGIKSVWNMKKIGGFQDVMTTWKGGDKKAQLYYYAFLKSQISRLLKKNGFEVVENYYIKQGKKLNVVSGYNIFTIARLT